MFPSKLPLVAPAMYKLPEESVTLALAIESCGEAGPYCFVPAHGGTTGVTEPEGEEDDPAPTALIAFTVNVYGVPLVNPVTVSGGFAPDAVNPPGDEITV